ncbi:MAG: DUF177 domain-containing protein [bacterium]
MRRVPGWRIPVESLKQGVNRLEFELEAADIDGEEAPVGENPLVERLVGPIRVGLDVVRSGRRLLVDGVVRFRAVLDCAVCGCEFSRDYAEALQTEFLSEGEVPPPDGKLMSGRDVELVSFRDDSIDVVPLVRDAVHLAIPIAPACRPDCQGICSGCGVNLNEGVCACPPVAESPFAGLRKIVSDGPQRG